MKRPSLQGHRIAPMLIVFFVIFSCCPTPKPVVLKDISISEGLALVVDIDISKEGTWTSSAASAQLSLYSDQAKYAADEPVQTVALDIDEKKTALKASRPKIEVGDYILDLRVKSRDSATLARFVGAIRASTDAYHMVKPFFVVEASGGGTDTGGDGTPVVLKDISISKALNLVVDMDISGESLWASSAASSQLLLYADGAKFIADEPTHTVTLSMNSAKTSMNATKAAIAAGQYIADLRVKDATNSVIARFAGTILASAEANATVKPVFAADKGQLAVMGIVSNAIAAADHAKLSFYKKGNSTALLSVSCPVVKTIDPASANTKYVVAMASGLSPGIYDVFCELFTVDKAKVAADVAENVDIQALTVRKVRLGFSPTTGTIFIGNATFKD